jgi:nucleoside-diphosphate-sugar epimerase
VNKEIIMEALIIGAAGGFGGTVGRELERRGHRVRALVRPGGRKPDLAAELVEGDALDVEAVARAARGADVIVWGFHLPYSKWVPGAVEAARVAADVAAREGATVLFPGNVYGLGPSLAPLDETAPHDARTRLGEIRNEIETIFEHATTHGARVVVLRAGDYFGPDAHNTWLELLTSRALRGGRILDPGGHGVPHAWAYLPDVARAGVDLLERRAALAPFDVFHFAGYSVDASSMIDEVRRVLGDRSRRTWPFPWGLVRAVSPFSKMLRLAFDMRYLWNEQVVLDGTKLRAALPDFRITPLGEALTTTLMALAERAGVPLSGSIAKAA